MYEQTDDAGECTNGPFVIVSVALSTTGEPGLDAWYREEHLPLLHAIPGLRRTRRYRKKAGTGPDLLAFPEIDSTSLFELPAYREGPTTPRRKSVMQNVTARERRIFGYHNTAFRT